MGIWQRYFLKSLLKTFFLFLIIFYGIYVLIDYASHTGGSNYHHSRFSTLELVCHYACEFVLRAEILVPFGLLIACVKTLCQLNVQNELVALLAAGYSKRRLLQPFLGFAFLITAILYLNNELVIPLANNRIQSLNEKFSREKPLNEHKALIHHIVLEDGSTLLFKRYLKSLGRFEETLWIRSIDEVWRIGKLSTLKKIPQGEWIEILQRNSDQEMVVKEAVQSQAIKEMRFNKKRLMETITPPDELSLTELWQKLPKEGLSEKQVRVLTAFYRKIAMPWLAFLALLGIAPFCMQFTRQLPVFLIYATSIFGLVAIYLTMNAATVLGERQIVQPAIAIFAPFTFFATVFILRFFRIK